MVSTHRRWAAAARVVVGLGWLASWSAGAQPPASPGSPVLDPAWLGAAPPLTCLPYRTGAIQHVVHAGSDFIALTHDLDPLAPTGYDGADTVHTVELRRTRDLSLVWSRVLGAPTTALAASDDGSRIVVGGYDFVVSIDAASATIAWQLPGLAAALAFGPAGEVAVSRGTSVDVVAADGSVQRTIAISGLTPEIEYAMDYDGDCHEIYTHTEARASTLVFAHDGTLVAGVSDGSVRALGPDDARRWAPPAPAHEWLPPVGVADLEPLASSGVRATYRDGHVVSIRTPRMTVASRGTSDCSAEDLALARHRLGASAVGEPPNCANVRDVDTVGRRDLVLGPITRAHDASGQTRLVAPTLDDVGVLVGDEAWLFAIDGTGERWALGDGGGRYAGALPIPGSRGFVMDVSEDGRYVAVGTPDPQPHGHETLRGSQLRVIDTRTETALTAFDGAISARARFLPGGQRIAIERWHLGRRSVEVRELPSGARVRHIELADAEYAGLVDVDATRVAVAEGPHLRIVSLADGAERAIDLPDGVIEAASWVGDRLAMRIYDRTTPDLADYRIDVVDLSTPSLRVVATTIGSNGHDVQLVEGGAAAIYVDPSSVARRLDVASGAVTVLAGVPAAGVGGVHATRAGLVHTRVGSIGVDVLYVGATATGTTPLDWARATEVPSGAIVYELSGDAYVVGSDGHTRATITATDRGLVVRTVAGVFSTTTDARDALLVRDGAQLRSCDATMETAHVPGLLEALLAP